MTKPKRVALARTKRAYFEEARTDPSPEWKVALRELLGFDAAATSARIEEWLRVGGYIRGRDGSPRTNAYDAFADDPPPETREERRARAAVAALMALRNLRSMYAPERVAAKRWHRTLVGLRAQASVALEAGLVREREDSYFLSKCSGETASSAYGKRLRQTRGVVAALRAVERRARDAQAFLPLYFADALSAAQAEGRPSKHYLGGIELDLFAGGFTQVEIGRLVVDEPTPSAGDQRKREAAAADRVRKRIKESRALRKRRSTRD